MESFGIGIKFKNGIELTFECNMIPRSHAMQYLLYSCTCTFQFELPAQYLRLFNDPPTIAPSFVEP